MEPRARVELATCRLRIGCSTTELPRLCGENYLSTCGKLLSILQEAVFPRGLLLKTLLVRKRIHRPADPYAKQQKKQQRPRDILHALKRAAPAQETKRNGYHKCEQQHRLQMAQMEFHLVSSLPAARGFVGV